jgi:hypothetical protein
MKLPFKNKPTEAITTELLQEAREVVVRDFGDDLVALGNKPPRPMYDDFDAFGGAILDQKVYVKECRSGAVVLKEKVKPYRRGMVKNKVVFYYLLDGQTPPPDEELIPSTWEV